MIKRYMRMSIRQKLMTVFLVSAVVIVFSNLCIWMNVDRMLQRINLVYGSNISLNDLQQQLELVQVKMKDYLDTKESDAMEEYYSSYDSYDKMIEKLNDKPTDNSCKLMEKNVRSISKTYLEYTKKAVDAKRARNVVKYRAQYENALELYHYIRTYIYSLNNEQFKNNTRQYGILMGMLHYTEFFSLGILLVIMAYDCALIYMLCKKITAPLSELAAAANQVSAGNFDIALPQIQYLDEVGMMTRAFQKMIESIRLYIDELKVSMEIQSNLRQQELQMEAHLKEAQLKYLQAQIHPHFLFNTLNAGAQLAMMEDAKRSYQYIQNVADFYRYNLRNQQEVTLKEELELIDHYIYILNVRFSGEILYHKSIDNTLLEIKMPGMILQPIVENSVKYGIRDMDGDKRIELEVTQMDEYVCVGIRDNGVGIAQDKIDDIMHGKISEINEQESNGVGMHNVLSRLRLFYGIEDVMHINCLGPGAGTEVILYIPRNGGENSCIK